MDVVVRATAVFFIVWFLMRVMGRRELSELTPFDLVVLVVIGDLIQQGVTQEDMSITGAALAAGTFVLLTIVVSTATYVWKPARRFFKGVPLIIIRDGEIFEDVLKAQRVDHEYLDDAARQQGIGDLSNVKLGVLETDGMISFIQSEDG